MSSTSHTSAPNLEYYRKQAKALLKAVQTADPDALSRVRKVDSQASPQEFLLAGCLLTVARENGFPSWPRFKQHLESAEPASIAPELAKPEPPAGKGVAIGDEAVRAKTGKGWDEWFAIFDAAGGQNMTHKEIVAVARENGVGPWWQQMVAVTYEQARGLRSKNMSCEGDYQVSVSKTINATADRIFDAWNDPALREKWLPAANLTIRKATAPKSLRITWHDGGNLDVMIYPKGESKAQCTADHNKLANSDDVDPMRAHWSTALDRLKSLLEDS